MQEMSGLDATFLYLETPKKPMHIGSVLVIDGSIKFEEFREIILSRSHLCRSMTQKLVEIPFRIDRPYWAEDPDFDVDLHLHRTALPRPGGWDELRYLASRMFSHPLDRSRPLWEFTFVEGLDAIEQVPKGSVGIICKVHHAAIDGVSGADMLSILFDVKAECEPSIVPMRDEPDPIPSSLGLLAMSATNILRRPAKLPQMIFETGKTAVSMGKLGSVSSLLAPITPFSAPRTCLNSSVNAVRSWSSVVFDLNRMKSFREAVPNSTLNDVVLSICAGALRAFLLERDDLPIEPLVSLVPISERPTDQRGAMGNQVSAMFAQLPTDIDDPVKRLERVAANMAAVKFSHNAVDANALMQYSEFVPYGLAGLAARAASEISAIEHVAPSCNCVITNVPGPQSPLYIGGHQLLANMGMGPIYDGIGILISVLSYNGALSISTTSSRNIMPDVQHFSELMKSAANDFEKCLNSNQKAERGSRRGRPKKRKAVRRDT